MDPQSPEAKAAEKQRMMWIILGAVAVLVSLGLWLAGRRKDPKFSIAGIRRRLFGLFGRGDA
jgi:hypothetical protein